MRVVLVGRDSDRARVREMLAESGLEIVGERTSLPASGGPRQHVDAIVLATPEADDRDDEADEDAYAGPPETLTPRELEVLGLLSDGLPNKAIAVRLAISDQTVKFHVAAIIAKVGARNRTDAVRRALRRGLVVY